MAGSPLTRADCAALDAQDPLAAFYDRFARPDADTIFLDANSMGAMPKTVPDRMARFFSDAWVALRRQGWNHFEWMERPAQIGAAIAPFIGARPEDVIACDNTTVNLFKLLSHAWETRPSGEEILTERGNFPTDLYVAQGLANGDDAPRLRQYESRDALLEAISPATAVIYLSHADYRTGARWDMADLASRARAVGAYTVWDLSHTAGAVPVDLLGDGADFAVGCGYKYLSGGPGGPAYVWAHPDHQTKTWPAIAGWMGHADVFAFAPDFAPMEGIGRFATGTPAVIANEVAHAAAEIWTEVSPPDLWAKHKALGDLMMALLEQETDALGVTLNTPRAHSARGGHVGFSHPGAGPVCEALLEAGVIGSFRKPNALRFGIGALALRYVDMWDAVARLRDILETERWRAPKFQKVSV